MVETLAFISATAKMNFQHEDCWHVYTSMIEPGIRHLLESYFRDWQKIEEDVTAIVMKHKGMFTTRQIITHIDENTTVCPEVRNVEEFRKIKRMFFSRKLCYLLRNALISQPIYDLLNRLAKRRNKIHEYNELLSEDDRILFAYGYSLLHATFTSRCFEEVKDQMKYQIEVNDNLAKQLVTLMAAQESSRFKGALFAEIDVRSIEGGWESERAK
jgi:hypothetical protein